MATKMNITFFMGNEILNIFSSDNFFEKKIIILKKNLDYGTDM